MLYSQRCLAVAWLVPSETVSISVHILCTPRATTMHHITLNRSHIRSFGLLHAGLFLCFHNPLNSNMNYRICNVRMWFTALSLGQTDPLDQNSRCSRALSLYVTQSFTSWIHRCYSNAILYSTDSTVPRYSFKKLKERKKERKERKRGTDRQTERETERQRERQNERQRQRHRDRDRERTRERDVLEGCQQKGAYHYQVGVILCKSGPA